MPTTVYLARPIDLSTLTEQQADELVWVQKALTDWGALVYNPAGAFVLNSEAAAPHDTLQKINRFALQQADALVAFWPELPGVGVSMEIEQARQLGMPVLVYTMAARKSWSLAGVSNAKLSSYPVTSDMEWLGGKVDDYQRQRSGVLTQPMRVQLDDGASMPSRGYSGDAGFDLYVQEDTLVEPGEFADIPCGCAVQLPDHLWAMITGRSSTLRTHKLLVATGIIDTGYRGPLFAGVQNLGPDVFEAKQGMRLAQLIPFHNEAETLRLVESATLDPSERGHAGFGSSGE